MKHLSSRPLSLVRLSAVAALAAAALSGCYVVPLHTPPPQVQHGPVAVMPAAPVSQTFTARLYPSNAEATAYGTIVGTVTNDLNGRGYFNAVIGGEQFQGEATRVAGNSQRSGVANASGTRGGMLSCRYTMNSSTLGTGSCMLNNGPSFTMHVGG
ncbi:MAG: hypothetical protein EOP81_10840 [Variovorax sp.]|nr:MAG: hypothetical protein EOP81_10840 [Variovorax sp.]